MLQTFLAVLPLLVAVAAMLARRPATLAAALSILTAGILTVTTFRTPVTELVDAGVGLTPTFVQVMLVLLGGVTLSKLLDASGDTQRVAGWIQRVCQGQTDRAVLLMVLGVTPFAESFTGFGLGLVVAVPLLRHLGFNRARSLGLGLLGLFLTTWGGLSPGTLIAAHLGGVEVALLAARSAWFTPPVTLAAAIFALWVGTGRVRVGDLGQALVIVIPHSVVLVATNVAIGPALGGVLASTVATVVALALLRLQHGPIPALDRATAASLLPYAVLAFGLLGATAFVDALRLTGPETAVASGPVWLAVASTVAAFRVRQHGSSGVGTVLRASVTAWFPVGLATGGFVVLGSLLTVTGMSSQLGSALAASGPFHAVLAPVLAGLSGVVTGSNSGANSMLAATQVDAAHALSATPSGPNPDPVSMLAVQNLASSSGTLLAPTRLALGRAVVGPDSSDPVSATRHLPQVAGFVLVAVAWLGLVAQLW